VSSAASALANRQQESFKKQVATLFAFYDPRSAPKVFFWLYVVVGIRALSNLKLEILGNTEQESNSST